MLKFRPPCMGYLLSKDNSPEYLDFIAKLWDGLTSSLICPHRIRFPNQGFTEISLRKVKQNKRKGRCLYPWVRNSDTVENKHTQTKWYRITFGKQLSFGQIYEALCNLLISSALFDNTQNHLKDLIYLTINTYVSKIEINWIRIWSQG